MSRRAACLACLVVALTGAGSPAWAADGPPPLPAASDTCVGESPTVWPTPTWAQQRMAPRLLWPLSRGAGATVAVLDTGVSAAVPALAGGVLPGTDVVAHRRADSDCRGRGTALAGLIAGRPATGAGLVGIAPAATVLPVRVIDGQGTVRAGALADGIRAAVARHADVVLVGGAVDTDDAGLRSAVADAEAAGVLLVAPAPDKVVDGTRYPAAYDTVIAVAGERSDGTAMVAGTGTNGTGTNGGGTNGGGKTGGGKTGAGENGGADLIAPAEGAVSCAPVGGGHYTVGGSGVAAAYVAGAATLLRAYRPGLSPRQVRERLQETARTLPGQPGAVDPYAALTRLSGTAARNLPPGRPPLAALPAAPAGNRAATVAAAVVAVTLAAAALAGAIAATLRYGRRRRWRPR